MKKVLAVITALAFAVLILGGVCVYDAGVDKGWSDCREELGFGIGHRLNVTDVALLDKTWHRAKRPLPPPADVYQETRHGRWAWFVNDRGEWLYRPLTLGEEIFVTAEDGELGATPRTDSDE